jgi:hypothetical protein
MPYEYFNDKLGVKANYLFKGSKDRPAAESTLALISERALRDRMEAKSLIRLRRAAPGLPALVTWESLPPSWQEKLIKNFGKPPEMTITDLLEDCYNDDGNALRFYTEYTYGNAQHLPKSRIKEYTLNASVLNALGTAYELRYGGRKELRINVLSVWDTLTEEVNRFREVKPHTLNSNSRRLRQKFNEYKNGSYKVLIHPAFGNKSASKSENRTVKLLNAMFAQQTDKPTKAEIYRQYDAFLNGYLQIANKNTVKETGELYDPATFPKLSESTVTAYLSKWKNRSISHSVRGGDRQKLMAKYKPYHSLEQPKFSGSIISIDDRQPPFEYAKGKRVWFYNAIDLGSEAITCWVYGQTKDGIILDFYRQLVRNYAEWGINLPAELEGELNLNSSFKDTFLQEGAMFQYVRLEPNNARGKRIEAYYRPLRYNIEKKREGWIARPFALSESNQAGPGETPVIPYDDIIHGCLKDIETWNNTAHSTSKTKTRWEYFIEKQNKNLQPTNYKAILPYLGYKTETSCNVGIIKLQGKEFLLGDAGNIFFGDDLIRLMEEVEGRQLDVYWLDDNEGKVLKAHVYLHGSDRYICEAIAKPKYNKARIEQTPEDIERREAMSKYVATIEGYINRGKKEIEPLEIIDNRTLTLNNKFSINLRKPVEERIDGAELLEQPEEDEDDFNFIEIPVKRSLKERF